MMDRRTLLIGSAAWGLASAAASAGPEATMVFGPQAPFSFDTLTGKAKELSQKPYQKPAIPDFNLLERLDFDAYQEIRFRPDLAIWLHGDGPYPVELFHLGRYFKEAVRIFVVSPNGVAQEVLYSPDLFTYGKSGFAKTLPPDAGFAGFRVLTEPGHPDWLAFLGASYFRSPAETGQYGLSSRGASHRRCHANAGRVSALHELLAPTPGGKARCCDPCPAAIRPASRGPFAWKPCASRER